MSRRAGLATLEATATVRRAGTSSAAVTLSERRAGTAFAAVTAVDRRSGTTDAALTASERRAGLSTLTAVGFDRRPGLSTLTASATGRRAGIATLVKVATERRAGTAYLTRSVRRAGVAVTPMPFRLFARGFTPTQTASSAVGPNWPGWTTGGANATVSGSLKPTNWSLEPIRSGGATAFFGWQAGTAQSDALAADVLIQPQEWRLTTAWQRVTGGTTSVGFYATVRLWRQATSSYLDIVDGVFATLTVGASSVIYNVVGSLRSQAAVQALAGDRLEVSLIVKSLTGTSSNQAAYITSALDKEGIPLGVTGTAGGLTIGFAQPGIFPVGGTEDVARRAGVTTSEKTVAVRRPGITTCFKVDPKKLYLTSDPFPSLPGDPWTPLAALGVPTSTTSAAAGSLYAIHRAPKTARFELLPPSIGLSDQVGLLTFFNTRHVSYQARFISPPLAAGTIPAQSWRFEARFISATVADEHIALALRVWRPSTDQFVGLIFYATRMRAAGGAFDAYHASGDAVVVEDGDRLVLDTGEFGGPSTSFSSGYFGYRYGGWNYADPATVLTPATLAWDADIAFLAETHGTERRAGLTTLPLTTRRAGLTTLNQNYVRRAGTSLLAKTATSVRRAGVTAATRYDRSARRAGLTNARAAEGTRRRAGTASLVYRTLDRRAGLADLVDPWLHGADRRAGVATLRSVKTLRAARAYLWPTWARRAGLAALRHDFLVDIVDFFQMTTAGTTLTEIAIEGITAAEVEDAGKFNYLWTGVGSSSIEGQSSASVQSQAFVEGKSTPVLEDQSRSALEVTREAKTVIVSDSKTRTVFEVSHEILDTLSSWDDASAWVEVSFSVGTVITLQDESFATVEVDGIVLDQFEFRSASWAILVKPYEGAINPTPSVMTGSAALVDQPPRPPPSPVPTVTGPGPRPDGVRGAASIVNPAPPRVRGKAKKE